MSWQATAWADSLDYDACGHLAYRVLIKLANVADENGHRAWRAHSVVADELGVSVRSVQRALKELEHTRRLIVRGDQRFVQHLRADRRPTVYNLAMRAPVALMVPLDGVTELSTGVTTAVADGVTTAVARTIPRTTPRKSAGVTTDRTRGNCGHDLIDATHCVFGCRLERVVA